MQKRKHQRSDIPYAQRLLMEKKITIAEHRNEAAMIALQLACVALNDTEGLGYKRISVFAKRLQELVAEYYEDPVIGDAHLKTRLEQLGFLMKDGRMFCIENTETGQFVTVAKLLEKDAGK